MTDANDLENHSARRRKWCVGVLNEKSTDEVPGSVVLLSKSSTKNAPLGLNNTSARTSRSSIGPHFQSPVSRSSSQLSASRRKKKTSDGKIVLNPQPEETSNDPLNWPFWRRNAALISLGFYCAIGGGMTPILAAGFNIVAAEYGVTVPQVALTTGLYMMGLGVGGIILSPTAIIFGKRPVYLATAVMFILSSVWCALSPSYGSLLAARIVQGIAVSPVEVLPSATVAEIFFLHERAFRLGTYTLLLLGGKNLIPLISAVVIQAAGWRWVFWVIAITVGFCLILLFFFLPETYWDRTPRPKAITGGVTNVRPFFQRITSGLRSHSHSQSHDLPTLGSLKHNQRKNGDEMLDAAPPGDLEQVQASQSSHTSHTVGFVLPEDARETLSEKQTESPESPVAENQDTQQLFDYTDHWRGAPQKSYVKSLNLYQGRLSYDNWFRVALRPFILFTYPAVLWSSLVYALSVGWLIVLSESVSVIYKDRETYNFSSIQTGLVYISPFIGAILGTAVAGKLSDIIVRYMARKNDGVYEPEFRLVMAVPIAITTSMGLMAFGWSAHEHDSWIVPTVFFGILSFGASLGSTTAITFCVDSYRQYAGEALVTLNVSKNILHGMVWSLFFPQWLESDGSKTVFIAIGSIHAACMLFSIPMYIYGKRLRMWTANRGAMDRF